jgi:hypothetical protein
MSYMKPTARSSGRLDCRIGCARQIGHLEVPLPSPTTQGKIQRQVRPDGSSILQSYKTEDGTRGFNVKIRQTSKNTPTEPRSYARPLKSSPSKSKSASSIKFIDMQQKRNTSSSSRSQPAIAHVRLPTLKSSVTETPTVDQRTHMLNQIARHVLPSKIRKQRGAFESFMRAPNFEERNLEHYCQTIKRT